MIILTGREVRQNIRAEENWTRQKEIKILCGSKKEIKYCLDLRRTSVFPVLEDLLKQSYLKHV
jgi:hypothetical protein